jgi:hypothetical protein
MKIYISGKITGLPFPEVAAKFQSAEELLEELDLVPVNPLYNGLTNEHSWDEHMVKDIEMLLGCDGILMLDNWETSDGAMIERYIAEKKGMDIWHETTFRESQKFMSNVKSAVYETTGLSFKEYTTRSRKRDTFFARMLFAKQCSQTMKPMEIASLIKRDRTTVLHLLKVYKDEVKYNPTFRELAQKVDNILNQKA